MNTTALRVVIDTNIFIASIGKLSPYRWIFDSIIKGKLTLVVSNEIIFEYGEVLARKTNKEIASNILEFLSVSPYVEKGEIYFNFRLIKDDPDDDKFADCAIASNADCLITNDKHFQILKSIDFPRITVFTLQEFENIYKEDLTE